MGSGMALLLLLPENLCAFIEVKPCFTEFIYLSLCDISTQNLELDRLVTATGQAERVISTG